MARRSPPEFLGLVEDHSHIRSSRQRGFSPYLQDKVNILTPTATPRRVKFFTNDDPKK